MRRLFVLSLVGGLVCTSLVLAQPKKVRLSDNQVFVQIRLKPADPFDAKSGCTYFGPKGAPVSDGSLKCGYPGAVSEVTWKYLKTTDAGDVYAFTRRFPVDEDESKEETKEVTYSGKEVVVFQDKWHRIGMAPKAAR